MTWGGLVVRSMLRSKRRTFLTSASIAMSVFLLLVLLTVMRELTTPIETDASIRRVVTRHKAGLTSPLPARYMEQIRMLPGIENVSPLSWFGGVYIDESNFFPRFAVDPDTIFDMVPEVRIAPEQVRAFQRQRDAAVVGLPLFEKEGWKIGERIRIKGDIYPVDLDLQIVGTMVFEGFEKGDQRLWFHHKYLDELLGGSDQVGTIWAVVREEKEVPGMIAKIDRMFANTEAETKTQTEKQLQLDFIGMLGNVKLLVGSICTVVVITLFIVVASIIAMTIRERTREIAILKSMGLTRRLIFTLLVAESVAISTLGGLAGAGGALFVAHGVDVVTATRGFLAKFEVTPTNLAIALMVSIGVGLFSCAVPAWSASRMTVIEGLKAVE